MTWSTRLLFASVLAPMVGCSTSSTSGATNAARAVVDAPIAVVGCSATDDPDADFISGMDEGNADPAGDSRPSSNDDDPFG